MAAKPVVPEINIEELKGRLQGLKTRADSLVTKKDALIREGATQDQRRQQAEKELAELGYPQAEGMDLQGLAELAGTLTTDLQSALASLEAAVTDTEKLLGVAQGLE